MNCDLCTRTEAVEATSLCALCGDTIKRLLGIQERSPSTIAYVDAVAKFGALKGALTSAASMEHGHLGIPPTPKRGKKA